MYKCIGCDNQIPWDGKSLFSYTCPCGSTAFYDEETGNASFPTSILIGVIKRRSLPHLGDLVGESSYSSPTKERFIARLRKMGSIWMEECEQCQKDGTLKKKQDREAHLALMEAERIIEYGDK